MTIGQHNARGSNDLLAQQSEMNHDPAIPFPLCGLWRERFQN